MERSVCNISNTIIKRIKEDNKNASEFLQNFISGIIIYKVFSYTNNENGSVKLINMPDQVQKHILYFLNLYTNTKPSTMIIDHIAIWTDNPENLRAYYSDYFGGTSGEKYINQETQYTSYFISFQSGARLEIMAKPGIPDNLNDRVIAQHKGIIHLAFGVETNQEVDKKAIQLKAAGYTILRGPRLTGDGYYEFETLDPDNNRIEVSTKLTG